MHPAVSAAKRYGSLLLMGAFLAVLLESPSRDIRLVAAIGLIVFAQLREITLLSDVEPVRVKKRPELAPLRRDLPQVPLPEPIGDVRKSYASLLMRQAGGRPSDAAAME